MKLSRLLVNEATHRWGTSLLTVLVVTAAAGSLFGTFLMLEGYARGTGRMLEQRRDQYEERYATYQDDMRQLTKKLGFNTYILPAEAQLSGPEAESEQMLLPEAHAHKLAASKLISVNHLVAYLSRKVRWPEGDRWITLEGTTDELYIKKKWQEPMLFKVPGGRASVGYEIHRQKGLSEGDTFTLLGRKFIVHEALAPQSPIEDETIRVGLNEAQRLTGLEGKISGIRALNCRCSESDIGMIRDEIAALLPGTQVRVDQEKVFVRAEARRRETLKARNELEQFAATSKRLHAGREQTAGMIAPLIILGAALAVGGLAWTNARQRRGEIGILRAIGLRSRQLLALLLGKAGALGLLGAIVGIPAGYTAIALWSGGRGDFVLPSVDALLTAALLAGSAVLCMIASWLPATLAANQDPAVVLSQE